MNCGLIGRKLGHSYSGQIHQVLADYSYQNVPVINGRGFAVHAQSAADIDEFKAELAAEGESISENFFNKWVDFETYRKIVFKDQHWN